MGAREAITEGYKAFEAAFHRGDAAAISRMYTEDAQWLVPETPIIQGREAIAEAWTRALVADGSTVRVEVLEVQEFGDWAYDVGRFTARAPGGGILFSGKYVVIWKRQLDGQWKIHRDIANWDIPPGASASEGVQRIV